MIKVGILEAASATGAEIVRILLNHPDIELTWAQSSVAQGPLPSAIRGIAGECRLAFCRQPAEPVDVVLNCSPVPVSPDLLSRIASDPATVRVIETAADDVPDTYTYGLCELNRKALVRGAMAARHVSPLAMAVELALLPLAKNLLLNSPIYVSAVTGTSSGRGITRRCCGKLPECDEIAEAMRLAQSSFYQPVDIVEMRAGASEGLMAVVSVQCGMALGEIRPLFEKTYDDHNFTFVSTENVDTRDIAGTNKCLLHLDKEGDMLHITSVLDPKVKGTAGNAAHILNLMFGLHERTGLALKSNPD